MDTERFQTLEESLPPEARNKLAPVRTMLAELVVTPPDKARRRLEERNVNNRFWFQDKAVWVPILQGSAEDVFGDLVECLIADESEGKASGIMVEQITAEAIFEAELKEQVRNQMRPDIDPSMREYYVDQMSSRMFKEKWRGKAGGPGGVQEIIIVIGLTGQGNRSHFILRVAADTYFYLRCSCREIPIKSGKPQILTPESITFARYYANVVTEFGIPEESLSNFSQVLREIMEKEEPSLGKLLPMGISQMPPWEYAYFPITCRGDTFFDVAKQVLAQWVSDLTGSLDIPFCGPYVNAGSAKVNYSRGGSRIIKYAVALLVFGPEIAA